MEISPQRIEIDLSGTGKVMVYYDMEVTVGGKKVQVMEEVKDEKGKVTKVQPHVVLESCDCLMGVINEVADSVKEGRDFVFPDHAKIEELAAKVRDRKPVPIEKPVPVVVPEPAPVVEKELYPETELYPEVEGGK